VSARELLLISLRQAHLYLETRISACATERDILYSRLPGSNLQSIGAIYAHAVLTEDHSFAQLRADSPLSDAPEWAELGLARTVALNDSWAASFSPDLAMLRRYAQTVYASTEAVLADLDDEVLEEPTEVHLPQMVNGKMQLSRWDATRAFALCDNVLLHMCDHTGEISALLGVQGHSVRPQ
jgi:hypothetical protein